MHTEIDLKLLKVINTLVVSGSVTKTAQLLNLSPGTISYALKKARSITGAHLFIRTKSGMKPDTTAQELSQRYQKFSGANTDSGFSSEPEAKDELVFMTYSPVEMMIAQVMQKMEADRNRYRFAFLSYEPDVNHRLEMLKNGQTDIDIGSKLPADRLVNKIKLFTSSISVLVKNDSSLDGQLTLEQWKTRKHAVWSVLADYYSDNIETSTQMMHHIEDRNVAMISGSIINMVSFCASSDSMMMLPDFFAPMLTSIFPVKQVAMPSELQIKYDCYIHFNNNLTENEGMMELISDLIAQIKSLAGYITH